MASCPAMSWVPLSVSVKMCIRDSDIATVSMTIYQPRLSNISTDTISKADLLEWAETVLRPVAELAYKGEGELKMCIRDSVWDEPVRLMLFRWFHHQMILRVSLESGRGI